MSRKEIKKELKKCILMWKLGGLTKKEISQEVDSTLKVFLTKWNLKDEDDLMEYLKPILLPYTFLNKEDFIKLVNEFSDIWAPVYDSKKLCWICRLNERKAIFRAFTIEDDKIKLEVTNRKNQIKTYVYDANAILFEDAMFIISNKK